MYICIPQEGIGLHETVIRARCEGLWRLELDLGPLEE